MRVTTCQAPAPRSGHVCLSCLRTSPTPTSLDLPESRVASNDSDSEEEEASELLSPADRGHRLSFQEKQGSEASTEVAQGSRSGSEEQLGAGARHGDGEGLAQQLAEFNTNQCNNVAEVPLPAMGLRGGRLEAGTGLGRQPEHV